MINPLDFFKVKAGLGKFAANHPKFFPFMKAVAAAGAKEGTIVEMKVTTPEGKELETNLRLTDEDIELIRMLREIGSGLQKQAAEAAPPQDAVPQEDGQG